MNEPAVPEVKVVVFLDVIAGAWLITNVNDWVALVPMPFDAVMVIGYVPPVVDVVNESAPLVAFTLTPEGRPVAEKVGAGWPIGLWQPSLPTKSLTAVVFYEYPEQGTRGANFVGITDGSAVYDSTAPGRPATGLRWLASSQLPDPLIGTHDVISVSTTSSSITVRVNGAVLLVKTGLNLPRSIRLGFSAGSGGFDDIHAVTHLKTTAG